MRHRWLLLLVASLPVGAAIFAVQSCGGVGGATSETGAQNVTADFIALMSPAQQKATNIGPEACAKCHGGTKSGRGPDDPIYSHWKQTVHSTKGVTCENCHGPGSAHQAANNATNIIMGVNASSPSICGQCHGPIFADYSASAHAQLIPDPVNSSATSNPAQASNSRCIVCHSGLMRTNVIEQGTDFATLTTPQVAQIASDTINIRPQTASCVTCHDPHKITGNLDADGGEDQLRHPTSNSDTTKITAGNVPATFTQFDHICAECHNGRAADGSDAKLQSSTSRPNMHLSDQYNSLMGVGGSESVTGPAQRNSTHATAPGQCSKCHMGNARHTFTVSYDTGCQPCHTPADAAARANAVSTEILADLVSLKTRMGAWATTTFGNANLWEYTSNIAAPLTAPNQALVPIQIKRARHNYYFLVYSGDKGIHNPPYARYLMQYANAGLDALNVPAVRATTTRSQNLQIINADRMRGAKASMGDTF